MIEFQAFSKQFGRVRAVTELTFAAGPGEIVALLGPNGSGKTTSIKAAAGLVRPTEGAVLIGEPGMSASMPAARQCCSFLPQRVRFPEALTGREVIEFYGALRARDASAVRDALAMTGLNGASARAVGTYSGGMTQRLGLAVALSANAPLLLLDEPTAALDPEGLAVFHGLLEQRRLDGRTVLFSSHRLADVERLADRILVLAGGRLVASLSAAELTSRLDAAAVLRIVGSPLSDALLSTVRSIAPGAFIDGPALVVPATPDRRLQVLDAVRASGVTIRRFWTDEGRLDDLYQDLVKGTP